MSLRGIPPQFYLCALHLTSTVSDIGCSGGAARCLSEIFFPARARARCPTYLKKTFVSINLGARCTWSGGRGRGHQSVVLSSVRYRYHNSTTGSLSPPQSHKSVRARPEEASIASHHAFEQAKLRPPAHSNTARIRVV